MKVFLFLLILLMLSSVSLAQQKIELKDISRHIGDSVVVCGKVFGGKYMESSVNQPTF